jgi:purine-binding chemotaxis protein CheW
MSQWEAFESEESQEQAELAKYLVFRLQNELYATPLLGVREVVEPQMPKHVPNTADYFRGLINIRGQVIGLVDLREKLGYSTRETPAKALLVFDTEAGSVAAIVDSVEAVTSMPEESIHKRANTRSRISQEYLIGIGEFGQQMVTIIDLHRVFSEEDYVAIKSSKMVG